MVFGDGILELPADGSFETPIVILGAVTGVGLEEKGRVGSLEVPGLEDSASEVSLVVGISGCSWAFGASAAIFKTFSSSGFVSCKSFSLEGF